MMPDFLKRVARPSGWRSLAAGTFVLANLMLLPAAAYSAVRLQQRLDSLSRPHVYLMRGFLNIFSLGMDQLATKIESHGIAASVYNHAMADEVVYSIAAKYRAGDHGPYILIGHSLGADAVMTMAQSLNTMGVPVALIIPFDGTDSYAAPQNVACVFNLTQRRFAYMRPGAGFQGLLRNIDLSGDTTIDHFTIDKSPSLQSYALNAVLEAAHLETCRPGESGPAVSGPRESPRKTASPVLRHGYAG